VQGDHLLHNDIQQCPFSGHIKQSEALPIVTVQACYTDHLVPTSALCNAHFFPVWPFLDCLTLKMTAVQSLNIKIACSVTHPRRLGIITVVTVKSPNLTNLYFHLTNFRCWCSCFVACARTSGGVRIHAAGETETQKDYFSSCHET
jgi:hypothetical protein